MDTCSRLDEPGGVGRSDINAEAAFLREARGLRWRIISSAPAARSVGKGAFARCPPPRRDRCLLNGGHAFALPTLRTFSPYTWAKWTALLPLINPTTCETAYFWRNRNRHVNVIRHQMTFFDPAFLLLCQLAKYIPEVPPQLPVKRLPAALGNEHNMIFAVPLAVA